MLMSWMVANDTVCQGDYGDLKKKTLFEAKISQNKNEKKNVCFLSWLLTFINMLHSYLPNSCFWVKICANVHLRPLSPDAMRALRKIKIKQKIQLHM